MATTASLSFYTTSPPARSVLTGALTLTNGGGSPVTIQSVSIQGPKNLVSVPEAVVPLNAQVANGHVDGGGAAATDFSLGAGASVSIPFSMPAVGGTVAAQAIVSDGSNPTATATITPV